MMILKRLVLISICVLGTPLWALEPPTQTLLEVSGPAGPLKGTLLNPKPKTGVAVLMIPGSGPIDRDGNSPSGLKASTYRLLAEGLAARGWATLRFDKRGMYASAGAVADANAVTIGDYVEDVRSWVTALRKETGARCVWMMGHSEGGLVALAAASDQMEICGLILVATAGRPMGEVLREQIKANPANAPLLSDAMSAIDTLERGQRVVTSGMHPGLQGLFNPAVQGFLISAFSYDPRRLISGISKPVLVLQGARDIQIGEVDARLLHQANPGSKLILLPDVNHVLKSVTSDSRRANLATYAESGQPLAPGVVEAIADFMTDNTGEVRR